MDDNEAAKWNRRALLYDNDHDNLYHHPSSAIDSTINLKRTRYMPVYDESNQYLQQYPTISTPEIDRDFIYAVSTATANLPGNKQYDHIYEHKTIYTKRPNNKYKK